MSTIGAKFQSMPDPAASNAATSLVRRVSSGSKLAASATGTGKTVRWPWMMSAAKISGIFSRDSLDRDGLHDPRHARAVAVEDAGQLPAPGLLELLREVAVVGRVERGGRARPPGRRHQAQLAGFFLQRHPGDQRVDQRRRLRFARRLQQCSGGAGDPGRNRSGAQQCGATRNPDLSHAFPFLDPATQAPLAGLGRNRLHDPLNRQKQLSGPAISRGLRKVAAKRGHGRGDNPRCCAPGRSFGRLGVARAQRPRQCQRRHAIASRRRGQGARLRPPRRRAQPQPGAHQRHRSRASRRPRRVLLGDRPRHGFGSAASAAICCCCRTCPAKIRRRRWRCRRCAAGSTDCW